MVVPQLLKKMTPGHILLYGGFLKWLRGQKTSKFSDMTVVLLTPKLSKWAICQHWNMEVSMLLPEMDCSIIETYWNPSGQIKILHYPDQFGKLLACGDCVPHVQPKFQASVVLLCPETTGFADPIYDQWPWRKGNDSLEVPYLRPLTTRMSVHFSGDFVQGMLQVGQNYVIPGTILEFPPDFWWPSGLDPHLAIFPLSGFIHTAGLGLFATSRGQCRAQLT